MAPFDFGKGLKDLVQNTVDTVKNAAKDIKIPDIKDIKLPDIKAELPDLKAKAAEVVESLKKKDTEQAPEKSEALDFSVLSTRCALKIIYYLMAADGSVSKTEEDKFDEIARDMDPEFRKVREQLVSECQAQLDKVMDPEDFYDVVQDGIEDALISSRPGSDSFVTPKLLVWDLLTVAHSDDAYDETERKLIKYIIRKTNIDKAVFLEMESSIQTLKDIEREKAWIKTTDRPYLTIEAMLNELTDRESVIFESVKNLISL